MTINIPNDIDNITFNGNDLDELKVNGTTIWSRSSEIYTNPMYIESNRNGSIVKLSKNGSPSETYYTSPDNSTAYQEYTYETQITLNAGDRLYWYSPTQAVHSSSNYVYFQMWGSFKVGGNIQSLNNYSASVGDYGYYKLFQYITVITDISELKLPATTVGDNGYSYMFYGCTQITTPPTISATTFTGTYNCGYMFYDCDDLTTPPVLPATTLTNYCYYMMFRGCTRLTTPPVLPATTLAQNCYGYMFQNCTSLTASPVLPATTLIRNCYAYMFYGCSSLSSVTALFTSTPNTNKSTNNWLSGVSSTGTFTMNANATWNPENYRNVSGVPVGWTVTTVTPQ